MKRYLFFLVAISFLFLLALPAAPAVSAQGSDAYWTEPYPLSSQDGQSGDPVILSDPFGYVHLFWPETGVSEFNSILYYSRFDGVTWSVPMDIILAPLSTRVAAAVDQQGYLHLIYTNRNSGNVYYTKAFIEDATSAQGWLKPRQLDIFADWVAIQVDTTGILHLLYSGDNNRQHGMFYTKSLDEGKTWAAPFWLDPDIPSAVTPGLIRLELGEEDSVHALWFYWDEFLMGRWIRYSHSFDQGATWSTPFTIDQAPPGSDKLRLPWPSLAVIDNEVHVVWAGDTRTHRRHRFSQDSGNTWNQGEFIFGDLHGMAIGDGVAKDGVGRLHFFGQIRWPQGVYHASWGQNGWSTPNMIYLITKDAFTPIVERIHAHKVRSAIRAGNQMVVTFTPSPSDPQSILYVMHMTMPDIPILESLPLPPRTVGPAQGLEEDVVPVIQPTEIPTERPYLGEDLEPESIRVNSTSSGLIWGLLPAIFLIFGIIALRFLFKKND